MPAGRSAEHADPRGIDGILRRVTHQEADCGIHVPRLRREGRFSGQAVLHAGDGEALGCETGEHPGEVLEGAGLAGVPTDPAAAVDVDYQRVRALARGHIDVDDLRPVARLLLIGHIAPGLDAAGKGDGHLRELVGHAGFRAHRQHALLVAGRSRTSGQGGSEQGGAEGCSGQAADHLCLSRLGGIS